MIPKPSILNVHPPTVSPPRKWQAGTLTYTTGGVVVLFFWLLFGDFAWSMRDRSVGPVAAWYLNELGVPNVLFGLLMSSFPALLGLFLTPFIGMKSDRHRGPRGRRIPFLLLTTPFAALGMIGLGVTPLISRWVHSHMPEQNEMVVAVICFGLFWGFFEVATLVGQAVFGGLINDVVPRPLLGRFFGLFRAVSLIDGIIFNFWLMGKIPTHFTLMMIVIGIFYGCAFMWVCFKVKEGEYPPPEPHVTRRAGLKAYFRECFANPYYLLVFLMMTIAGASFMPVNIYSIPYAKSLGVDMDHYGKALAITFSVSLLLSYFFGWLADVFHPLRMAMGVLVGYVFVSLYGALFVSTPTSFLVTLILHGILSGSYYTSAASLGQRLFPHEKFGQFASAGSIVAAPLSIILAPTVGILIDGFQKNYRLTFSIGLSFALTALVIALWVYRRFLQYGGPNNYVAPE